MKQTLHRLNTKIDYGLLMALVIPLMAVMPLLTHRGLPNTADGPVHLMRQVELNQAWAEGNFYPRWGTDLALGHGMPIFSYAPPSLYHLTQLIHLTGLPLDEAMKGVVVLDFLLYGAGMFLFARRIYGPYPALLAAGVYVYAPYRLREAYIQGNYGQFTGLAFYPLIFWAFHGLITDGRARYWIAVPLALAGLLLSHNISSMIFAPLLAAYLVFLLVVHTYQTVQSSEFRVQDLGFRVWGLDFVRHFVPSLLRTVGAGLLGLALSAIFWLPAFGERHDIKLEGITQGFFDFRENFISLPELLSPPVALDLAAINPEFPLSLGLAQIIGAAAGIIALTLFMMISLVQTSLWGRKQGSPRKPVPASKTVNEKIQPSAFRLPPSTIHTLFFTAALLLYTFLTLPQSQTLWENVPLIELTEFPWRMLGPAIFCAAVLSAAALALVTHYALRITEKAVLLITGISIVIVIVCNAHYLYPSQFIVWGTPTPADAFAYEAASGAIGTTSTGEFLPRWAQQHPQPETLWPDYEAGRPPQRLDSAALPPGTMVETISHQSESDTLFIDTPQPFKATLRTLYWPGWQPYLNGQPVPFTITPNTGLIQVDIPAGQHTLLLILESTPLRRTGLWLTVIATVIILSIAAVAGSNYQLSIPNPKSQTPNPKPQISHLKSHIPNPKPPIPNPQSPTLRTFAIATVILLALYLLSRPLAPLFVLQSDPNIPQPADIKLKVDFADQIRLVGADHWPPQVTLAAEGETDMAVVLYWKAQQALDTNYSLFLHLDTPDGQTAATVDEVNPENIPTRNWPPGLYLRNVLHLKIPADLPPIRYNLTTGVYNRDTGERLPPANGEGTLYNLGALWLVRPQQRPIPEALASFGPDISLHRAELTGGTLNLVWQTRQPVEQNYSIFVHLLDAQGNLLTQADGVPYNNLYPLPNWLPRQPVLDTRRLEMSGQPATIAIGLYDPATGQRLPATDAQGNSLSNNSYQIPVSQ